jgi:radical SAM superfamily enzyme YgiQ (UPF0313 family)
MDMLTKLKEAIMSRYMDYEKQGNIKNRIVSAPVDVSEMNFQDLYEDISSHWHDKAAKLQARRMRKIRKQLD